MNTNNLLLPPYDSYPPLFRPSTTLTHSGNGDDPDESATDHTDVDRLPVIDFGKLSHGRENKDKLAYACREWGIFRLVNHGIPTSLISQLHGLGKELFSMPFESKQGLNSGSSSDGMAYFWGTPALTPGGVAMDRQTNSALDFNWVEGFNVPLTMKTISRSESETRPELWAEEPMLDAFRDLLQEYGSHQSRLATTIFEAIGENLYLNEQQLKSYLSLPTGFIRFYRFPRCFQTKQAWGMDVHTDSSVFSILNHDVVGGLQLCKDEKWFDVKPIPNTLVVNLGDMIQAISDDKYKSVKHRVKANKYRERISIGYFVFPEEDVVIKSTRYRPFTYADFRSQVQEDVRTVGSKVGLQRFKLTVDDESS